jgi:hypothetical protein
LLVTGHDECARDRGSLRAVDVACVAEPQPREILAGECSPLASDVELEQHLAALADVEHFAASAVLDPLGAGLAVLLDHRHAIAGADAVVGTGHVDFQLAELAALCPVVLRTRVETVDLYVRCVGDQRDLLDRELLRQPRSIANGALERLVAIIAQVQ